MKTERKTAPAVLRRGMAFLCTLVLSLMAVTLPASAANQITGLDNTNIGLSEDATDAGKSPFLIDRPIGSKFSSLWEAHGTTINGTVKPEERYKESWGGKRTYQCCTSAYSILTITNNSGEDCRLRFSYTVPKNGSLYINDKNKQNDGSYGETLAPNASVTVKLTTPEKTTSASQSTQAMYTAEVTLQNIELISMNADISVTLAKPTNGSYTAIADGKELGIGTHNKPMKTEYTFTRGAADPNYAFDGWYVNGDKKSSNRTFTTAFTDSCTVEARFMPDPLLSIIQLGKDVEGKKTDYIAVNSDYQHGERSWRREAIKDVKDGCKQVFFADSRWSVNGNAIQSSASGKAETEWQISPGRIQALADIYSDVIRVKCLDDCTITFNCKMTAKEKTFGSMTEENEDNFGAFLYCYTSNNPNVTSHNEFITGTAVIKSTTNDSRTATVTVNEGQYLYLYAYARTIAERETLKVWGFMESKDFSYSAEISSITVSPNNEKFTFSTQNKDNMGNDLASGTVKVIGANQTSSSWQYNDTLAKGTTMTLTPGTAPKGYTFIGWHNVTDNVYDYTNNTYTVTLTRNLEVNPIYVPVMTIMTGDGANGYENATYQYKNLSNKTVKPDGQYVARGPIPSNGGNPAFYTSLKAAFDATNTVFLLAGDIINGDLTIPAGKTLVIPDRFADPGPGNDKPEQVTSSAAISSYCKVTYSGKLTVYGKLVVNARQSGNVDGVCGCAVGGIGCLSLSGDSTVTVEKGGELCGYGLIRGGSIFAKDGSVVRELMEISDRRGALPTQTIYENRSDKKVFPYNNYSIKTIESTATYETGATLYAQYSITLDGNIHSSAPTPLFAKAGALFNLTKGTMTKSFDPETRKTIYRLDEDSTMGTGSFSLSLEINKLHVTINTNDYLMPLNAGFDLRTAGEMTMNSSFKFLPGASLSVEKGGKCTVVSGADLLFYRLNDYDTRGPGVGEHQKGYSSKAYPVSATKLPDDPSALTLSKIGSARLNVDGEMIVNGGLYVSNELISESNQGYDKTESVDGVEKSRKDINAAYFTDPYPYDNGYNILTGTGTIKMTNALKDGTAYEAMTATNNSDIAWATVPISPIKGLTMDATADISDNYQPLNKATTYYGVYRLGGFYAWTDKMPQIAKIVGGGNETTTYSSLANAVQAYTGTGYIQMLDNSTEPGFTVSRNVTLDLNGKTVTLAGDLTVAKGFTLSGMDSSTGKDYVTAPTGKIVGKVTGTVAPVFEKPLTGDAEYNYLRYVAIKNDAGTEYTFHRFNISVTGYRFELATGDTPQCALFFIGKFQGDDAAKKYLSKLGFTLTDIDGTPLNKDDVSYEVANKEIPPEAEPGDSPVVLSGDAYLFEVYLMRSFKKDEPNGYTEEIGATAQATFKNNGTQDSKTQWLSFQEAWQNALTDSDMDISPAEKEILEKFLEDLNIPIPNPNPKTE